MYIYIYFSVIYIFGGVVRGFGLGIMPKSRLKMSSDPTAHSEELDIMYIFNGKIHYKWSFSIGLTNKGGFSDIYIYKVVPPKAISWFTIPLTVDTSSINHSELEVINQLS